ncbi:hypothetical protein [Minisyncoccus archaeiphilus]|uniref:hypothetical protein n=1 Tax=Minisyncoccus archaeiphilus TaxID=3238481 RepID=UPI00399D27FD
MNVVYVLNGENYFLVVDKTCENPMFLSDKFVAELFLGVSPLKREVYGDNSGIVTVSINLILKNSGIDIKEKENCFALLFQEIMNNEFESKELLLGVNADSEIERIKSIGYGNYKDVKDFKKVINEPNQKVTINSNQYGANKIAIEKKIK